MRPQRQITKNIKHRYVRPTRYRAQTKINNNEGVISSKKVDVVDNIVKENNDLKNKDMENVDMKQVDALLQAETDKLPKRKVKVEKKDKGILERTENSRVILTEDNKMLLND